jgi:glucose/arabinose dehydrogenase
MNKLYSLILLLGTLAAKAQVPTLTLAQVASGFTRVTTLSSAPGDDRLFVCEKAGVIKFFRPYVGSASTTFLNINSRVVNISSDNDERGLLGLAFDPNYTQNGRFYVNYINNSGNTVIARYTVSGNDPNAGNFDSEQILLTITQPYTNHNGGCLAFGPDGYLYIGMGDGGSGGDPQNYSQNPNSLLGKMLRIDVSGNDAGYTIPADNPFTAADDPTNSIRDEIWAIGVRNPWRWSFDRISGDMWIADVGQNQYEEVNLQPASSTGGENYGWRCYEANNTYYSSGCLAQANYTFPIYNYTHSSGGCSITGGYVYRGNLYNDVFGRYFYTDYCDGVIRGIIPNGAGGYTNQSHGTFTQFQYTTFGEDQFGEVYIAQQNGVISRLTIAASLPRAVITSDQPFTQTVCEGEGILLKTGANPLLNYEWFKDNNAIQNSNTSSIIALESGNYKVTVTSPNGTVTSEEVVLNITSIPEPSAEWTNPVIICSETEIDFNTFITGTIGGNWSGANFNGSALIPNESIGNNIISYSVGIGACVRTTTQAIYINTSIPAPSIVGGNSKQFCSTDSIQPFIEAVSEVPLTINWYSDDNLTNLISSGLEYNPAVDLNDTVYVAQSFTGCLSNYSAVAIIFYAPDVSIGNINSNYCLNNELITAQLSPSGGIFNGPGVSNIEFNPSLAGPGTHILEYFFVDSLGCSNNATLEVTVDSCVGIESNKKQELAISPNPFGDFITISNAEQVKGSLKIVNALGQTVLAASLNGSTQTIGTHVLPKGSYFVVIQNASGQTVRKLIKN